MSRQTSRSLVAIFNASSKSTHHATLVSICILSQHANARWPLVQNGVASLIVRILKKSNASQNTTTSGLDWREEEQLQELAVITLIGLCNNTTQQYKGGGKQTVDDYTTGYIAAKLLEAGVLDVLCDLLCCESSQRLLKVVLKSVSCLAALPQCRETLVGAFDRFVQASIHCLKEEDSTRYNTTSEIDGSALTTQPHATDQHCTYEDDMAIILSRLAGRFSGDPMLCISEALLLVLEKNKADKTSLGLSSTSELLQLLSSSKDARVIVNVARSLHALSESGMDELVVGSLVGVLLQLVLHPMTPEVHLVSSAVLGMFRNSEPISLEKICLCYSIIFDLLRYLFVVLLMR